MELGLSYCTSLRSITLDFHSRPEIAIMGPLVYSDLIHRIFEELFDETNSKGLVVILDLPPLSSTSVETLSELDTFGPAYLGQGFSKLIIFNEGKYLNTETQLQVRDLMPTLSARGIITFRYVTRLVHLNRRPK